MFWRLDAAPPARPPVADVALGRAWTYGELRDHADRVAEALGPRKRLVFLFCDNSFRSVAAYLGGLRGGHAVFLGNADLDPALRADLLDVYQPDAVWPAGLAGDGPFRSVDLPAVGLIALREEPGPELHPELGVLLSTSGTTGSPKLARLSFANVQANAASIAEYLQITDAERPLTSLPMGYSYGLSVINSHLLAGATIVTCDLPVVQASFWTAFRERSCTSMAGVPYTYEMLERLRFARMALPTLRTLTQAGGKLAEERIRHFYQVATDRGYRFYVMYGQTEATARISYVPWDRLGDKIGSIGVAIPEGRLWVDDGRGGEMAPAVEGELVYSGPNVMLGYGECREDLARGDELGGMLRTGDVGYRDADGYFYVTGRLKRFLKVYGLRLNLDEAERQLERRLGRPVACVGRDDLLVVVTEGSGGGGAVEPVVREAQERYGLHSSAVRGVVVAELPRTTSGKKDYRALTDEFVSVSS